jgi:hypothetical protein
MNKLAATGPSKLVTEPPRRDCGQARVHLGENLILPAVCPVTLISRTGDDGRDIMIGIGRAFLGLATELGAAKCSLVFPARRSSGIAALIAKKSSECPVPGPISSTRAPARSPRSPNTSYTRSG